MGHSQKLEKDDLCICSVKAERRRLDSCFLPFLLLFSLDVLVLTTYIFCLPS